MNSLVIIAAAIALALKAWVLLKAFSNTSKSSLFFSLTAIFCIVNILSLIIVANVADPNLIEWVLRPHYVCTTWAATVMCAYAVHAAQKKEISRIVIALLFGSAITLTSLILATDLVIKGAMSIGYSITAIKGEFFFVFFVYSSLCFLFIVKTLLAGSYAAESAVAKNRCVWTLVALAPLMIVATVVVIAMYLGFKINGSGLIPFATSVFLLITLKTEYSHGLTDIRRFLPFSPEYTATRQLLAIFSKYTMDEISFKELKSDIGRVAVQYKYSKQGTVSATARSMKMNRTTLTGLLKKYHLKP